MELWISFIHWSFYLLKYVISHNLSLPLSDYCFFFFRITLKTMAFNWNVRNCHWIIQTGDHDWTKYWISQWNLKYQTANALFGWSWLAYNSVICSTYRIYICTYLSCTQIIAWNWIETLSFLLNSFSELQKPKPRDSFFPFSHSLSLSGCQPLFPIYPLQRYLCSANIVWMSDSTYWMLLCCCETSTERAVETHT